jgi:hypothetical protein
MLFGEPIEPCPWYEGTLIKKNNKPDFRSLNLVYKYHNIVHEFRLPSKPNFIKQDQP